VAVANSPVGSVRIDRSGEKNAGRNASPPKPSA
jgi:hypothetical protein